MIVAKEKDVAPIVMESDEVKNAAMKVLISPEEGWDGYVMRVVELGEEMGTFIPVFAEREQQVDYPMFKKQVEHFVECIRTGSAPHPGGREGMIAMKVVDAVYESALIGKAVEIA